jgi:hypothetical protein
MNLAPSKHKGASRRCSVWMTEGASAPSGAPALTYPATDRPTTTTEWRQVVGDTPLLILRRQK